MLVGYLNVFIDHYVWILHLQDAVDCPEWIVPFHVFKSLVEEVKLFFFEMALMFLFNMNGYYAAQHMKIEVHSEVPYLIFDWSCWHVFLVVIYSLIVMLILRCWAIIPSNIHTT